MKHQYFLALMGAWMITGGISLFVAQPAKAGDCGCEVACGCEPACGMEATCGAETDGGCNCQADCGCEPACGFEEVGCGAEQSNCGCEPACGLEPDCGFEPACGLEPVCGCEMGGCDGGCKSKRFNPVYRSLDAVAGGIEKLFRLNKRGQGCGGACGCETDTSDCGCSGGDVMMVPAPMPPHSPRGSSQFSHGHHQNGHIPAPIFTPSMRSNSTPLPPNAQAPSIRTQPRISAPRLVPTPSTSSTGQHFGSHLSPAPLADPDPMQRGQSISPPMPTPTPDSVPDAFSDPFGDDEVHVRRFQPIKPSAYQAEVDSPRSSGRRSVSGASRKSPLSPSYRASSRRSTSVR